MPNARKLLLDSALRSGGVLKLGGELGHHALQHDPRGLLLVICELAPLGRLQGGLGARTLLPGQRLLIHLCAVAGRRFRV